MLADWARGGLTLLIFSLFLLTVSSHCFKHGSLHSSFLYGRWCWLSRSGFPRCATRSSSGTRPGGSPGARVTTQRSGSSVYPRHWRLTRRSAVSTRLLVHRSTIRVYRSLSHSPRRRCGSCMMRTLRFTWRLQLRSESMPASCGTCISMHAMRVRATRSPSPLLALRHQASSHHPLLPARRRH